MADDGLRFVRDFILQNTYFKSGLLGDSYKEDAPNPPAPGINPFAIYDDHAPEKRPRASRRAPLCQLPTDTPSVLGSVADLCAARPLIGALDPLTRLATILRFAAAPLRWEPLNNCSTHRAIPSPRYLFTCDTYILLRTGAGASAYLHHPDEQALELIGASDDADDILGASPMGFCVVGDVSRCARPYGNFALSLVAPEAGLQSAQLGVMCAAMGWRASTITAFSEPPVRRALHLTQWSRAPLALMPVDLNNCGAPALPRSISRITGERVDDPRELDDISPLRNFMGRSALSDPAQAAALKGRLAAYAGPISSAAAPEADGASIEHPDLADAIRQRSSGLLVGGLAPIGKPITLSTFQALAQDCRALASLENNNELRAVQLAFTATTLSGEDGGCAGQFRLDLLNGEAARITQHDHAPRLRQSFSMVANLKEMGAVITISTDQAAALNEFGARAFFLVQQATGMWLQFLSLACARRGLFLRPVRSYSERGIEPLLPLEQQIVFQCLIGRSRRANILYDIG